MKLNYCFVHLNVKKLETMLKFINNHPVHMTLSNQFGTDSNIFRHHVNATKNFQIDSKPIQLNLFVSRFETDLKDKNQHVNALVP